MLFRLALIFLIVSFSCMASHQYEDYQEQFQRRLQKKYPNWDFSETYFFKVPLKASSYVDDGSSKFNSLDVYLNDNCLHQEKGTNIFIKGNASIIIDMDSQGPHAFLFDRKQDLEWKKTTERLPVIGKATDLDSMLTAIVEGYWIERVTYTTNIPLSKNSALYGLLKIQTQSNKRHPLNAKSMAISYLKERHKTGLFFDIYNAECSGNSLEDFLEPIVPDKEKLELFDHEKIIEDDVLNWFKVLDDRIYRYPVRSITYKIFPDLNRQEKWMPPSLTPIKDSQIIPKLDYQIFIPDENAAQLEYQLLTKILTDLDSSRYYLRIASPVSKNSNYLYCDGNGNFFTTRSYEEIWCYANSDQKQLELVIKYVVQSSPELQLRRGVNFLGGYGTPKLGFYEVENKRNGFQTWILKGINFNFTLDSHSPFETIPAIMTFGQREQIEILQRWDPISSLSISLQVSPITEPYLVLLEDTREKINVLNLSKVSFGDSVSWSKVFETLAHLKSLTDLDLSKNRLGKYKDIFPDLSNCLERLKELKVLKIQGQEFQEELLTNLICQNIVQLTNLTELHIDHLNFYDASLWWKSNRPKVYQCAEILNNLSDLKSFHAYNEKGEQVTNNILRLASAKRELQHTLTLSLSNSFYVDERGVVHTSQECFEELIHKKEEFIQAGGTLEEIKSMISPDTLIKKRLYLKLNL